MTHFNTRQRLFILTAIDSLIVSFSIFLGYFILKPFYEFYPIKLLILSSIILLISHFGTAYFFGLYHRAWEYASISELMIIVRSISTSILITATIVSLISWTHLFIRLYFITWMLHLIFIGGSRMFWRIYRRKVIGQPLKKKPTLIVGAGQSASLLLRQMNNMAMEPLLAVDDNPNKQKMVIIDDVKVQGTIEQIPELIEKYKIQKLVVAIPSLEQSKLASINEMCNEAGVDLFKMPNINDVLSGELEVNQLKKIDVEDLLGREPVELDMAQIAKGITNQTVLVTGAGGSIGSEICRQICNFRPQKVILLGHGENSIYLINQELINKYAQTIEIIPVIADIQNKMQIASIINQYKPHAIYHAAAHKHVPLMEVNADAAFKNNVIGTKNIAEVAKAEDVKKFVMISTDKAVNPTNVMGSSKRIAEMIVQSLNDNNSNTQFVAVRFGNVLGSRGSVIPLFKKQIEQGGPVTVTHPDMTRYFMTIPEAARLVLQAGALAKGGEIFVLDMGEPVKIVDLAKNLIKLSGKNSNDIRIEYSGIRPGEKLFEELLKEDEIHPQQIYDKIYIGKSKVYESSKLYQCITQIGLGEIDIIDFARRSEKYLE
ncbi:polysaccharide biosynthesis protein [Staphylococcus sp. 18_1_E_LY]|uniref:Polysaccharide biosynthesis protein n=1 Tax=Staphylococcus lloydii TaxID=2781774 RepID=A0A7T1B1R8_9STAP|nr:nucleoside-diphosphate sugar epimerase/dehydratase [Staphylococcus lloydii]MBF7018355.1 polysaccharide biosynthesis protein [Staphylococcus lloydii]MBF7026083.1 polysaccharide biosynthesis protein [Staphylococcus lloydii]QPM76106.1 polysaccharide biosynthesis protein [Staphylococcus lloydii]